MIRGYIISVVIVFVIAGCAQPIVEEKATEFPKSIKYSCDTGKSLNVTYFSTEENDHYARIRFEATEYNLIRVISASGEKYSDDKRTWWAKGDSGFFKVDGVVTLTNCFEEEEE